MCRRSLTYNVSLLLVLLRKRLVEFETSGCEGKPGAQQQPARGDAPGLPANSTNEARIVDAAESTIRKVGRFRLPAPAAGSVRSMGGTADSEGLRRRPRLSDFAGKLHNMQAMDRRWLRDCSPRGTADGRSAAGYRLHHLEVFNWGTFDQQLWRLTPGGETSLLTGDIGSGKSTLVDALTTLLMPPHKIAYNKAAGAESKERTLRSYVEGHYKSERIEASGRSRAIGLREGGKTYSVVLSVFVNEGYDETVTLAAVFHQRDRSTPDRFFVTSRKPDDPGRLHRLRKRSERPATPTARRRSGDLRRVSRLLPVTAPAARNQIGAGPGAVPPDRIDEVGR